MNKGDKLVCIKTYVYGITEYFTEGKVYEVMSVAITNEVCIPTNVSNIQKINKMWFAQRGTKISVPTRPTVPVKMFDDYFITMAECREKQIKSVLDD